MADKHPLKTETVEPSAHHCILAQLETYFFLALFTLCDQARPPSPPSRNTVIAGPKWS